MEVNITSRDPLHARSWQQITSASVFEKGESSEDIRRDICLLTTMMAIHNAEPTISTTGTDREDIDCHTGQLQRLCHISTLLDIGGRCNEAMGAANITFAQMETECATLVCAYTERLNVPREQTEPKAYEEIVPIEGRGQQLLENWFEARGSDVDTVHADQHLIDVVAIMHYLRSITDPIALSANTFALSKFITCRARYQLASRLRSLFGTKLWTENPLTIVKEWFSDVEPSVHAEPRYLAVNSQAEPLFARYDLFPSPAGRGIPLALANVLQWVAALEGIIDELRMQFPRSVLNADAQNKLEPWPIQERDVVKIVLASLRLEHLLNTSFLWGLEDLKPGLAAKLRGSHLNARGRRTSVLEASTEVEQDGEAHSADDGDDASSVIEDHENGVQHLQRFLRSIVAWHAACYALTGSESIKQPLRVFKYTSSPQLGLVEAHVQAFVNSYLQCLDQHYDVGATRTALEQRVRYALEKGKGKYTSLAEAVLSRSKLHAKASLMALAHSTSHTPNARLPKSGVFTSPVVIHVSGKCCWCCDALAKVLQSEISHRFVLPETHATILPWVPPSGIPVSILKTIRNDLFEIFNKWICTNPVITPSS